MKVYRGKTRGFEKMNEFCKEHELTYRIFSQPAFYYPTAVLFVVFYDPRTERSLKEEMAAARESTRALSV